MEIFLMILMIFPMGFANKISLKFYKAMRNLRIRNNRHESLGELNREINVKYSPAVLSYLMDNKLETQKDVVATLLNLYAKKIIDIKKKEDRFIIVDGINKKEELGEDEKYVYIRFVKDEEGNSFLNEEERKFNYTEWWNCVVAEYKKYDFWKRPLDNVLLFIRSCITLIVIVLTFMALYKNVPEEDLITLVAIISPVFIFFTITVFNVLYYVFYNIIGKDPYLTESGIKEVIMWLKFKRFIKEYTLIEDRTVEEIQIYEKYIPYAIALNMNKEYRKRELELFNEEVLKEVKKEIHLHL